MFFISRFIKPVKNIILHMLPNADDGQQRIKKYLLENATPEANPIPKDSQEKPPVKKETPKNDEYNTYDYSDDDKADDKDW